MPRKKTSKPKGNTGLDKGEEEETSLADDTATPLDEENEQTEAVGEEAVSGSANVNEENNTEGDPNSPLNDDAVADDEDEDEENGGPSTSNGTKKTKKRKKRAVKKGAMKPKKKKNDEAEDEEGDEDEDEEGDEDEVYEVQKILDVKVSGSKREFLIRWKNYTAKNDTWEPEENLSCNQLIEEFMSKHKAGKKGKRGSGAADQNESGEENSENTRKKERKSTCVADQRESEEGNFEVEKVVGVEMVGRKRRFKIRWKDYSPRHDTWEPEENLSCDELIENFMKNNEKENGNRKLRTNRKTTKKFVPSGVLRASKRTQGKERDYAENETDE